ncbi:hypothetical protein MIND_00903900 [Mycena indigotica]|uniref:DUF6532 domain-containing protein n=1 Tax=Mycena indigotica TaxID=2126181 RepID=A0A8H6SIS3_9AGAR|nr:uncharacterized protein MIND_00903900 [Mycena indigotica]KAF7299535.1 hypothetical protein MIND_00903900 [Mycena indigotica]
MPRKPGAKAPSWGPKSKPASPNVVDTPPPPAQPAKVPKGDRQPPTLESGMSLRQNRISAAKPDMKKASRRSTTQAAQDRASAAADKETRLAQREQGKVDAAVLERASLRKVTTPAEALDHPLEVDLPERQLRERPKEPLKPVDYGVDEEPRKDPISSGSGTEGEFQPENEEEEEESSDEVMDVDSEEEPAHKKKSKAVKGDKRREVAHLRDTVLVDSDDDGAPLSGKRKTSARPSSSPATRKKARKVSGLHAGWENGRTKTPSYFVAAPEPAHERGRSRTPASQYHGASSRSHSAGSALSVPMSDWQDSERGGSSERPWGMPSDEDDMEESKYADNVEAADVKAARQTSASIAGIVKTEIPGLVPVRSMPQHNEVPARLIRHEHLPRVVQPTFWHEYGSELIGYMAGLLPPWERPTKEQVIELYNESYDREVDQNSEEARRVWKLSSDRMSDVANGLAKTALAVIDAYCADKTAAEIQADVARLLTIIPSDDFTEYRHFFFESVETGVDDMGSTTYMPTKVFRHPFVIDTFAAFCKITKDTNGNLGPPSSVKERPCAALVLTVQAIQRALECWESGTRSKTVPAFSKDNYARPAVDDIATHIKLHEVTGMLSSDAWDDLIARSRVAATNMGKKRKAAVVSAPARSAGPSGVRVGLLGG